MHLNLKLKRISISKIGVREYALFSMYSAPFIDLINGAFGGILPVGQIVRTIIVLLNLSICALGVKKGNSRIALSVYFSFIYIILHSFITSRISSTSLMAELSFGMKLMLLLSEMLLLTRCVEKKKLTTYDFEHFWKFSCWFVPVSLIITKILSISHFELSTESGLYSSVNAMSMIFIVQFVLCIYFGRIKKVYWIGLLLNIIAVVLLGTKSPYLYMAAIVISLMVFYSKHRIRMIIAIILGGIGAYYVITHFFSDNLSRILDYQITHLTAARTNNSILGYLFSGRNMMLKNEWNDIVSKNLQVVAIIFGIGRGNFVTGIEMDFFEILFSFGMIVTSSVYIIVLKVLLKNAKGKKNKHCNLFLNIALICLISFGTLGGHTFLEAIAATYSAILIGYKYATIKNIQTGIFYKFKDSKIIMHNIKRI